MKRRRKRWLPKFDSVPWLSLGIACSFFLVFLNVWALIDLWQAPFLPFQLTKILGIAIGLILGIHCVDMIGYYRKHGRLKKD